MMMQKEGKCVVDMVRASVEQHPHAPAMLWLASASAKGQLEHWSYGQLWQKAIVMAQALRDQLPPTFQKHQTGLMECEIEYVVVVVV